MMSRRITLTIAAAILAVIGAGIIAFALTTNEPQAATAATPSTDATAVPAPTNTPDEPTPEPTSNSTNGAAEATTNTDPTPTAEQPEPTATAQPAPAESTGETAEEAPIAAIDGAALYETHCASCHGANGEGGSGGAVNDIDMTLTRVIEITTDGVPRMPAFAGVLTPEEIEAVSEFTLSLGE